MKESVKIGRWVSDSEKLDSFKLDGPDIGILIWNVYGGWNTSIEDVFLSSQDIADMLHIHQNTPEQLKAIYG